MKYLKIMFAIFTFSLFVFGNVSAFTSDFENGEKEDFLSTVENVPVTFDINIDAAITWKQKVYIFKGFEYIRISMGNRRVDPGYPKVIAQHWKLPSDFNYDLDAAVQNGNQIWFFKGKRYVRYDMVTEKALAGYPKKATYLGIPDSFLPLNGAIYRYTGPIDGHKIYFFNGNKYVRYDVNSKKKDKGPTSINVWKLKDDHGRGMEAAVTYNTTAYFMRGTKYVKFNLTSNKASKDAPKRIQAHFYKFNGTPAISHFQMQLDGRAFPDSTKKVMIQSFISEIKLPNVPIIPQKQDPYIKLLLSTQVVNNNGVKNILIDMDETIVKAAHGAINMDQENRRGYFIEKLEVVLEPLTADIELYKNVPLNQNSSSEVSSNFDVGFGFSTDGPEFSVGWSNEVSREIKDFNFFRNNNQNRIHHTYTMSRMGNGQPYNSWADLDSHTPGLKRILYELPNYAKGDFDIVQKAVYRTQSARNSQAVFIVKFKMLLRYVGDDPNAQWHFFVTDEEYREASFVFAVDLTTVNPRPTSIIGVGQGVEFNSNNGN